MLPNISADFSEVVRDAQTETSTIALFISLAVSTAAFAAQRTVTLVVPGMHCLTCSITLNKALKIISGVEKIDVKLDQRQIVVT
jgi:mercuric ion binding protein